MVVDHEQPSRSAGNVEVLALIEDFERSISHLSFAEITQGALRFMSERLQVARASVALLRAEGDGFWLFDTTLAVNGVESGRVIPHGSASLSETVESQRPVYRADLREWSQKNPVDDAFLERGLLTTFSVPLVTGGRCTGTLNAAQPGVDALAPSIRQVIELIAPRLAFALEVGRSHDALTRSEARFRDVFDTVGDGVVVAEAATLKLLMMNPAMCRLVGCAPEDANRLTLRDLHPRDRLEGILPTYEAATRNETRQAIELPVLCRDGSEVIAEVSARGTAIGERACVVAVYRDAVDRRRRQDEQVQVQKLESIRTLAAGIAHDFNNLLTGLVGNVSLAQMQLDETSEVWELLDEAQQAATRATSLTRQLLTFAKGGAPLRGRTRILTVLREAVNAAAGGTNLRVEYELGEDDPMVVGDSGQLSQVFQNLVRNAADAMPEGGVLRVRSTLEASGQSGEICLEFTDEGPGIAPEQLDRIFDPFYTTKRGGVGLGLPAAYSIVHNHGGRIQAASVVGLGTTFRVILPAELGAVTTPQPPQAKRDLSARVLFMDDEALVRQVSERALRTAGYVTQAVTNGAEAVDAYAAALENGQRFDVVILDLRVSGAMGGREAAERILAIDPSARLLVSSGYSEDAVMSDYRRFGFSAVLPKPYRAKQLCDVVEWLVLAGPFGAK